MADTMDRQMDLTSGQSNQQPHTLHSLKPTAMVFTCGQTDIQTRHYHASDVLACFSSIILVMSFLLACYYWPVIALCPKLKSLINYITL